MEDPAFNLVEFYPLLRTLLRLGSFRGQTQGGELG